MSNDGWKVEFADPSAKYRGQPFWSWNGKLDKDIIKEQIDSFSEMGYGGFHIHSRVGLADEYLGDKFMDCVKYAHDYASEKKMLVDLYDEDKWPSGAGGGRVTKTEAYRARCLLLSKKKYPDGTHIIGRKQHSRLTENGITRFLSAYSVLLDKNGYLTSYKRVSADDPYANYFAYEILTDKLPWFNEEAYADLLNPDATKKFIEVTHEIYKRELGKSFSNTIPSVFTDEPQHSMAHTLQNSTGDEEIVIPYTNGIDEAFISQFSYSFFDKLPEIIWNDPSLFSIVRWQYHEWITERFSDSFFGIIEKWCNENNLMFAGHVMRESKLSTQTECIGEAMRLYARFHLPGLDILADDHEYSTAKQVQSVAHQYGKNGIICEMLGVTNWDFDFKGHRHQSEWLMALGTTVRVPHLAWMYMGGESKRDYPAALDSHSPWYSRYKIVEDPLSRINVAMQQGECHVRIAVIHPIESYWGIYGPDDQTLQLRNRLENNFQQLIEWLLFGQLDFDFAAESLLQDCNAKVKGNQLCIGEMKYDAVIVPPLITIRSETYNLLKNFSNAGGKLIIMGNYPERIDGIKKPLSFSDALHIGFDHDRLLDELEPFRDIRITDKKGLMLPNLIYQFRKDKEDAWLFVAVGKPAELQQRSFFRDAEDPQVKIEISGEYSVELCNPDTGACLILPSEVKNGRTYVSTTYYPEDCILLYLKPADNQTEIGISHINAKLGNAVYLPDENSYALHEENVLLLDYAEFRLDGGRWNKSDEILRIDNAIRDFVNYPKRTDAFPQPWLSPENKIEHTVDLKYVITSETDIDNLSFAYEGDAEIFLNGKKIGSDQKGYYIDRAINRISIGQIHAGNNELMLKIPFGIHTNLESCYLLGQFGVRVTGNRSILFPLPEKIGYGPLYLQGFPFYGGNISYISEFESHDKDIRLFIPNYGASFLDVKIDDGAPMPIWKIPYCVELKGLQPGLHKLEIIAYGNRINQFGQVHNCSKNEAYFGPNSWRSIDSEWSYTYQLRKTGVLSTPYYKELL